LGQMLFLDSLSIFDLSNRSLGMHLRIILISLVIIAGMAAAVIAKEEKSERRRYDCSAKIEQARQRVADGRHSSSQTLLNEIILQCGGHQAIDSALYLLGTSYLASGDSKLAKNEFLRLVSNFPNSEFAQEARFRIGYCSFEQSNRYYRDQTETREAIRELSEYRQLYPGTIWADSADFYIDLAFEKLAKKDYHAAKFYYTIEEFEAAVIYYQLVIKDFPTFSQLDEVRFYLADALMRLNRQQEAAEVINLLIDKNSLTEVQKNKLEAMHKKLAESTDSPS